MSYRTGQELRAEVAALKEQLRVFHSAEATLKRTEAQLSALRRLKEAVYEMGAAPQHDLERGVAWMNDEAHVEYAKKYPLMISTTNTVHREMDVVISAFNLEEK